MRGIAALA